MLFLYNMTHAVRGTVEVTDPQLPIVMPTSLVALADHFAQVRSELQDDYRSKFLPAQKALWAPLLSPAPTYAQIPYLSCVPFAKSPERMARNSMVSEYAVEFHHTHLGVGMAKKQKLVMRVFDDERMAAHEMFGLPYVVKFRCEGKFYCVY
jgi:hypothetical protein